MIPSMRFFVGVLVVLLGVARCSVFGPVTSPVTIVTATPGPPSPPIHCTENPPGLTVQVILGLGEILRPSQSIAIKGQGFLPGEMVSIDIEGQGVNNRLKFEGIGVSVDDKGDLTTTQTLQLDEPNMNWQVEITHQRGVACVNFITT